MYKYIVLYKYIKYTFTNETTRRQAHLPNNANWKDSRQNLDCLLKYSIGKLCVLIIFGEENAEFYQKSRESCMVPWAAKFQWIIIINISLFVIMLYSKLYFNTLKAKDVKRFQLVDYTSMFSTNKTGRLPCINSIHLHLTNRSWRLIQPRNLHYHLENCLQASTIFTHSCSMTVFLLFIIVWEAAEEPV